MPAHTRAQTERWLKNEEEKKRGQAGLSGNAKKLLKLSQQVAKLAEKNVADTEKQDARFEEQDEESE